MNVIQALKGLFHWLCTWVATDDWERERYFSRAQDLCDLEYRMRNWEQRQNDLGWRN